MSASGRGSRSPQQRDWDGSPSSGIIPYVTKVVSPVGSTIFKPTTRVDKKLTQNSQHKGSDWISSVLRPASSPGRVNNANTSNNRSRHPSQSPSRHDETPSNEQDILQKIVVRETLLNELTATVGQSDPNVSLAKDLCSALRHVTLGILILERFRF
jgi:hypothetical protein